MLARVVAVVQFSDRTHKTGSEKCFLGMERILDLLKSEHGVLVRRDHQPLGRQLDYCLRRGRLVRTLPGIYTAPEPDWLTRIRAATAFRPGCVLTGAAAAVVSWWPECPIAAVSAAVPHAVRGSYPGFAWEQRRVPLELITDRHGLRFSSPALSTLDLLPALGGRAIDEALRRRVVGLRQLWNALALTPARDGNLMRRELLEDSRDEPWSESERLGHHLLRAARVTGWRANYPVTIKDKRYFLDIAFPELRLAVEIDGWEYHNTMTSFIDDRWRLVRLGNDDWLVLPFAAGALLADPDGFVEAVKEGVELRQRSRKV